MENLNLVKLIEKEPRKTRPFYKDVRQREYLFPAEIDALCEAALQEAMRPEMKAFMIRFAFNHALRVRELLDLEWNQIDFQNGVLAVRRLKNSNDGTHFLNDYELTELRRLYRNRGYNKYVFAGYNHEPITSPNFFRTFKRIGERAKLDFPVHPHMLRHAKGYALANQGIDTRLIQEYLGHKNIEHTVRYTQLAPHRVKGLENIV